MKKFELTFTDVNNVLRVNSKGSGESTMVELAMHDAKEPGRPNTIPLTPNEVRMLANHLLCLVRE